MREPLAHADARTVHLDAADARVRAREVHVLEDAEGVPPGGNGLRGVEPFAVHRDDLARLDVTDYVRADEVERTRLGRNDPVVANPAERQRAEAEGVAERHERVVDERRHGVRAL